MRRSLLFSIITSSIYSLCLVLLGTSSAIAQTIYPNYGYGRYNVSSPTAGQIVPQGTNLDIKWTNSAAVMVQEAWISSDGGGRWSFLSEVAQSSNGTYTWAIPRTYPVGTRYQILLTDKPDYWSWNAGYNAEGKSGIFSIVKGCFTPALITNLAPSTKCTGTSHVFSVATDMTDGTFTWRKDGTTIATTTTPSYIIPNVRLVDAGFYDVVVADNCNPATARVTSALVQLTVIEAPTISANPAPLVTICESGKDTLRVTASGSGVRYQWNQNGVPIPGAILPIYVIDNAGTAHIGLYTCTVSGTCLPSVTSTTSDVSVPLKPRITQNPVPMAVCPGSSATLSVTAIGTSLTYQWSKNDKPIAGANMPTYVFPIYDYSMDGAYRCIVTSNVFNPNNCVVTAQSLIVDVAGYQGPVLTKSPESQDVCVGGSVTLTSKFDGPGLSYVWTQNGTPIANATSNSLTISNATAATTGQYVVTASGTCNLTANSTAANITVVNKPIFTTPPVAQSLKVGDMLVLSVVATDARMIQWTKDSKAIPGADSTSFVIDAVKLSDAGYYNVLVSNVCGGVSSAAVKVSVKDPALDLPELTLSQTTAAFGEIPIGYSKDLMLTGLIQNTGNSDMNVTGIAINGTGFSIVNAPATPFIISAGNSAGVDLLATPPALGNQTGSLNITTNAPNPNGFVALSAMSVLRYDNPQSSDYGDVEADKSKEQCITIHNTSAFNITIEQVTAAGANSSAFTVITTLPLAIAAGASENLCVRFAPGSTGDKAATLSLISSTGGNSTINVTGKGVPTVSVEDAAAAGITVSPNPMRESIEIRFGTAMPAVNVDIVSNSGQIVAQLSNIESSTPSLLRWNGRDLNGTQVASGTYTVVVRAGNSSYSIPLSVVR